MLIPLTQGKFAIIDDEDFSKVSGRSWTYTSGGYAFSGMSNPNRSIYMHRLILGLSKDDGIDIDHINGNKLDNRKENLRLCNQVQNNGNFSLSSRNHSGYKGVCWDKREKKYRAKIQCYGIQYWLGYFSDSKDAALAYNKKAKQLFGEFARLNDVP